jgi:Tfp pilus assembly protein PilN
VIEINLLPGSTKKRGGGRGKAPRRSAGAGAAKPKLPEFDRTKAMLVGGWVIGLGLVAWLHMGMSSRLETLHTEHEAAVRDSTRFAILRAQGDSLMAKENAISQKLQVIQDIDAGRYIWPHILDEVSRALPPYIWINTMSEASTAGGQPRITIDGRAGNYFALGRYIEDLEASPFLRGVRLMSSSQIVVEGRTVLGFAVQASYEEPSPDVIQTVPLFGAPQGEN